MLLMTQPIGAVNFLRSVDLTTGVPGPLLGTGGGPLITAIDFASDGNLYGLDVAGGVLQINPTTGARTLIGNTGNLWLGLAAIPAPVCVEPPAGLVSWWPGDGTADDIQDGNDGTLQIGATFAPGFVTSGTGQAFDLDGANAFVQIPDAPALRPEQFTLDAWVKADTLRTNSFDAVISHGSAVGVLDSYFLGFLFQRPIFITRHGGSSHAISGSAPVTLNEWHHIAATFDGAVKRIYLDGNEVASAEIQTPITYESVPVLIGQDLDFNSPAGIAFNGLIDEVEIYNRALTPVEIEAIFVAGIAGKCKPSNQPPVADAGSDQTVECNSTNETSVILDGSASSDPDGDPLTHTWTGPFGTTDGPTPRVDLPLGEHVITLTVDDGQGVTDSATVTVVVEDTAPPTIDSLNANPTTLWPPNHKMVSASVATAVADACDAAPTSQIISVSSNEPVDGLGRGDRAPDWQVTGDFTLDLRAERSGHGNGRVYTLTVECVDASGNTSSSSVDITVPHDQRK